MDFGYDFGINIVVCITEMRKAWYGRLYIITLTGIRRVLL